MNQFITHAKKNYLIFFISALVLTSCVVYQPAQHTSPDAYQAPPPPPPQPEPQQQPQQEQQYQQPQSEPQPQYNQQPQGSYELFYNDLSPYGNWVDYSGYGYVWIPTSAGPSFTPYQSQGYWTMTDYGWTWVSYYAWGWAPFHYGRWGYDNYYG